MLGRLNWLGRLRCHGWPTCPVRRGPRVGRGVQRVTREAGVALAGLVARSEGGLRRLAGVTADGVVVAVRLGRPGVLPRDFSGVDALRAPGLRSRAAQEVRPAVGKVMPERVRL